MLNDPLSDLLQLSEARPVMSGGFSAGGAWALRFPAMHAIKFSAAVKGGCWARVDGSKEVIRFEEGDVGLMSGKRGYLLGSDLKLPALDAMKFFDGKHGTLSKIGDGKDFTVLAGGVELSPSNASLLVDLLPPMIHVRASSPNAAPLRWIVEQIALERGSTAPGTRIATAQLAQLLFTQVLRTHLAGENQLPAGRLRAIADRRIAPALRLIHGKPGRVWRLGELAKSAAMSRTSFAVHFKAVAGIAPLEYLTEWRMRLAQRTLRDDASSVAEIASSLGYTSESAFSHAFKRVIGLPPRDYRKSARASAQ